MKRLWVQQTLAFSIVVIVTMGAVFIWINQGADVEFRKYVTLSKMNMSGSGVQELVEYYRQGDSWDGVERLLSEGIYFGNDWESILLGATLAESEETVDKKDRPDVLLADAGGRIVFDSAGKAEGRQLKSSEKANALRMKETDTGKVVGYLLLFYPFTAPIGGLEQQFLDRLQQILLVSTSLAVMLILVVGALLNRRLNAPLQRLADAARAVAGGDLGQQVEAEGSIEVAQVGQAFNEMTAALHEAETLRQNMVADVAHELRTPLSVLQGNLWAILNDVYPLEKAEISRLYDEIRLLSRLVDDLRELASADAGQLHLNLIPVDVAQVVRHTVDNFALAAEAQELSLTAQLPDDLPSVLADPDRVAQVLRNLLVNALRHTPLGGAVTVSAAAREKTVEISITDTGEGIAPEDLPHVFERFWRVDPARARSTTGGEKRLVGGSGLGLVIARAIVELHNGRVAVTSDGLGRGTTVRFEFPLHSPYADTRARVSV